MKDVCKDVVKDLFVGLTVRTLKPCVERIWKLMMLSFPYSDICFKNVREWIPFVKYEMNVTEGVLSNNIMDIVCMLFKHFKINDHYTQQLVSFYFEKLFTL